MKIFLLLMLASGSALAADADLLQCRTQTDTAQRLACYDAIVVTPPAVAKKKEREQAFGLEQRAAAETNTIDTSIPGLFEGWGPKQQITLANGQVWRIADDSTGVYRGTDLKVTLERGSFGSTYMKIHGLNQTPAVRRVK